MGGKIGEYLADPLLGRIYREIKAAGPLRSISVDLTHHCNLRCDGCYFFAEGMDDVKEPRDERDFEAFIEREVERSTNFVTVVGGEPSLRLDRLRRLYETFRINVATNGLTRIPFCGFENLPIGISVWGAAARDTRLRGGGRIAVFDRALENYRDDPRAFWYYTVSADGVEEIPRVVERCIANGNRVLFNFYSPVGGGCRGADDLRPVRAAIESMIALHPQWILITPYLSEVSAGGGLFGEKWGHAVCTSLSENFPGNQARFRNGRPWNRHFRAYNADFRTTRRCCTGTTRECSTCFDVWEHFSWIMLNMRKHMRSIEDFGRWLSTVYLFYYINRLVPADSGSAILETIHRLGSARKSWGDSPLEAATRGSAMLRET